MAADALLPGFSEPSNMTPSSLPDSSIRASHWLAALLPLVASNLMAQRYDFWVSAPPLPTVPATNVVTDPANGLPTVMLQLPNIDTLQWDGTSFVSAGLTSQPLISPWSQLLAFSGGLVVVDTAGATWVRPNFGNWTSLGTLVPTPPQRQHACISTSVGPDGKGWVYGGQGVTSFLADLWSFDGVAWANETSAPGPQPGPILGGALVQDGLGGKLVIGGMDPTGAMSKRIHRRSASGWTQLGDMPESRQFHGAVLDIARSQILVIGGFNAAQQPTKTQFYATIDQNGSIGGWTRSPQLMRTAEALLSAAMDDTRREVVVTSEGSGAVMNNKIASLLLLGSSPTTNCVVPTLSIAGSPRISPAVSAFTVTGNVGIVGVPLVIASNIANPVIGPQLSTPLPNSSCLNFLPATAFLVTTTTSNSSGAYQFVNVIPASPTLVGLCMDLQVFGSTSTQLVASQAKRLLIGRA